MQRQKLIAALTNTDAIRTYLTGVGLPADPPVIAPARPPPQPELEFAAGSLLLTLLAADPPRFRHRHRYVCSGVWISASGLLARPATHPPAIGARPHEPLGPMWASDAPVAPVLGRPSPAHVPPWRVG